MIIPFDKLWEQYNRVVKPDGVVILFAVQPFTQRVIASNPDNLLMPVLAWDKCGQYAMSVHEDILVFSRKKKQVRFDFAVPNTVFRCASVPQPRLHPTQKPVPLLEKLIQHFTQPGDLILDNACGVGSTLIAAKNLGRRFVGIEKETLFYFRALNRMVSFGNQD